MKVQRIQHMLFLLIIFLLPTQFGKHFWPMFASVNGIRLDYLSPTLYTTDILIVLLFCIQLLLTLQGRQSDYQSHASRHVTMLDKTLFGVGCVVLVVGSVTAVSPQLAIFGIVKIVECGYFSWYAVHQLSNPQAKQHTLIVFSLAMILESLLGIAEWINHGSLGGIGYYFGERTFTTDTPGIANAVINGAVMLRPYATLPHPNVLAGYLLFGFVLILPQLQQSAKKKPYWFLVIIISSLGLLATLSRAAIALWCLLITLLVVERRIRHSTGLQNTKWQPLYWVFGGTIFCIVFFFSPVGPRFLQTSLIEEAVTQRQELLIASFRMLADHLLFGVGVHNFLPTLPQYLPQIGPQVPLQPVHNIVILIATETGLLGEFIATYFYTKAIIHSYRKSAYKMLALLLIVVLGMTDHYFLTVQQGQLLLAFGLGYALSG